MTVAAKGRGKMERIGIEPVTSGLQGVAACWPFLSDRSRAL
jgi:hypothetical protein